MLCCAADRVRDGQIVVVCARSECGAVVRQLEQILAETEGAVGKAERAGGGEHTTAESNEESAQEKKKARRRTQQRA